MRVAFVAREFPLDPVAVAAVGANAKRLGRALARLSDARFARLRGVAAEGLIVVLGEESDLPWVDGAIYLGRAPDAPALLLPTTSAPALPAPWVERALLRAANGSAPIAVIPESKLLVSIAEARTLDRDRLARWMAA